MCSPYGLCNHRWLQSPAFHVELLILLIGAEKEASSQLLFFVREGAKKFVRRTP